MLGGEQSSPNRASASVPSTLGRNVDRRGPRMGGKVDERLLGVPSAEAVWERHGGPTVSMLTPLLKIVDLSIPVI